MIKSLAFLALLCGIAHADSMNIPLPDGRVLHATRTRVQKSVYGESWIGAVDGQPGSLVALGKARGATAGFVTVGAETFEISGHRVRKAEQVRGTIDDVLTSPVSSAPVVSDVTSAVHDLLVVYTPSSSARYGQATLESMILAAVAAANQAYSNSLVPITLNLVGLQEIAYVDGPSLSQSLTYLQGQNDGQMDGVHALRDSLHADVVVLISEDIGCGVSFLMAPESLSFSSSAFAAVYSGCLSQHTLAHEIGHLQGNMHDAESSGGMTGAFPYSYGYRRCGVADGFRTVMATQCTMAPRVTQFSSPEVLYNGYPTGIADQADNARSMRQTMDTVAAFRGTDTAPPPTPSLNGTALTTTSIQLAWTDVTGEVGYEIERLVGTYTVIASVTDPVFVDTGLVSGTQYKYRVRSFNSAGYSAYSNVVKVTTKRR